MKSRDWLVTGDGQCQACKSVREWDFLRENYRLYRFLTEVEDVLTDVADECSCLPKIRLLVRRLITNSYWIQTQFPQPCSKTGFSLLMLYDELGFPLTVQTETVSPGAVSRIHSHGTWGVVALLKGEQKNTFWKRSIASEFQKRIEAVGEVKLVPGDIISFTPDAIHSIEALGDEPTITFNLYGETDPSQRFEFDPVTHTAKKF